MRKFLYPFLILASFSSQLHAQNYVRNTSVIDTPTAFTVPRGTYQMSLLAYEQGGVEFKAFIGIADFFYFGGSFDMENAIGKEKPILNVPGFITKLKFTDGWESFPISLAIGYDSFYIGQEGKTYNRRNRVDRVIHGPYFVVTKPIYILDDEQHIHFGVRMPMQPDYVPEDTAYFLSLDVPLGEYFIFKAEMERVYYNFTRPDEWLYNIGLRFSYQRHLGVEFDFMFQPHERVNRVVRIEYTNEF